MGFPKRNVSHVIGDNAVRLFMSSCDPSWIISSMEPDYGLDLRIEIASQGQVTGEECYVQVKGSSSITPSKTNKVRVKIRQETINYWLGKLNPVLVVRVDITSGFFWFDWLEHCYPDYPEMIKSGSKRSLTLSKCSKEVDFLSDLPRYIDDYFKKQRVTLARVLRGLSVVQILFHVTRLWQLCANHVIFVQKPVDHLTDEEILGVWQLFYEKFAFHDIFMLVPWHRYASSVKEPSGRAIVNALETRFKAYEKIRAKFLVPEDADQENLAHVPSPIWPIWTSVAQEHLKEVGGSEIKFFRIRYQELMDNILPTMAVLEDTQNILFQLMLLGRVKFVDEEEGSGGNSSS